MHLKRMKNENSEDEERLFPNTVTTFQKLLISLEY